VPIVRRSARTDFCSSILPPPHTNQYRIVEAED
jgi:hypothetical protein